MEKYQMKHLRPSRIEYKKVMEKVLNSVHYNEGSEYREEYNPYEKGTTNFGRFERQYPKVRRSYLEFEVTMKEMEEVYGPIRG